jgi:dTDP-4-dehydrorhamnose 3,5-epimerase
MKEDDAPLSERLLNAAARDVQTVSPEGNTIESPMDGVVWRDVPTHADERGTVFELYDPRWGFHPEPMIFSYCFTIRPGFVKGWNVHKIHDDRYCVLQGEMEVVLYDVRPGSATYGQIRKIVLSEHRRRVLCVPRMVWHADHNIGARDVVAVNFPTAPYDHASPDKYRLPIDTPLIPHSFPGARGW